MTQINLYKIQSDARRSFNKIVASKYKRRR